jgi:triacylglycerol lipase
MSPLAKGAYWVLDYVFAVRGQIQGFLDRTDPATLQGGDREPVLLIPGIWETWRFLLPVARHLHDAGHPVHVLPALRRNGAPVASSAEIVRAYLAEHDLRHVVIVAHSKGGLIGKYAMLLQDPEHRVGRMIAVSTPFNGSAYAPYTVLPSLRAFSPKDATTALLGKNLSVNARITSIYAAFDPHIPGGSTLPGATNVRLPTSGHFRILRLKVLARPLDEALAR